MSEQQPTRREVLQKAVYISPVILTLPAVLSFASAGSGDPKDKDEEKDEKDKETEK